MRNKQRLQQVVKNRRQQFMVLCAVVVLCGAVMVAAALRIGRDADEQAPVVEKKIADQQSAVASPEVEVVPTETPAASASLGTPSVLPNPTPSPATAPASSPPVARDTLLVSQTNIQLGGDNPPYAYITVKMASGKIFMAPYFSPMPPSGIYAQAISYGPGSPIERAEYEYEIRQLDNTASGQGTFVLTSYEGYTVPITFSWEPYEQ